MIPTVLRTPMILAMGLLAACSGSTDDDAAAEAATSSELRWGAERLTRSTWVRELCQGRLGSDWQSRACSTGRDRLRFTYPTDDNDVDGR